MFTVKFFRLDDQGAEHQTSISTPNVSVFNNNNGHVIITTYPTMVNDNGIERHVMSVDEQKRIEEENFNNRNLGLNPIVPFDVCFIENEKGKTIQHIKQPK